MTQEQLAEQLSITYQSVSKWENNITSPDLYLLPAIADYFETSIDELFLPDMQGYKNKAARLLALYEHRKNKRDFNRAEAEFEKLIADGKVDAVDYHHFGLLYQCRAKHLNQKAEANLQKAIDLGCENAEGQLQYLLSSLGRHQENIAKYEAAVKDNPENATHWNCLVASYAETNPEKAFETATRCLEKSPGDARFLFRCGWLCRQSEDFAQAEAYFLQAIEADADCGSARYYLAFLYADAKEYAKAIQAWEQVIALCARISPSEERAALEAEWPRREIARLQALMAE